MSKDITITSTTDSQEEVNAAASIVPDKNREVSPKPPNPEGEEPPEKGQEVSSKESEAGEREPAETGIKPGAEPEPAQPQKTEADTRDKGKGGFTKRIDILTKRNAILEERLTSLADQHEELMAELRRSPPRTADKATTLAAPATEAATLPSKPTPDQFLSTGKTYEDYLEALTEWKMQVRDIQAEEKRTAESRKAEEVRTAETFADHNRRMNEASERYEDFDEVMARKTPIPRGVGLAIIELENGPDIAYYLGKNPDICEELMGMSELSAIAEIGAISASLTVSNTNGGESKTQAGKAPVSSSAPAPIKPGGGASTKSSVPLDEVDYPTYRRVRAEQEKARYRT
jgi:hypothetical protein